jgi:hypothetical protein
MTRALAIGILTAGALAVPTPVGADHGGASPHDFVSGGGTNGLFQIGLTGQSEADGTDPRGYVSARSRPNGGWPVPFRFGGEVTCLRVDGNRASIKYRFDHSDPPELQGGGIQIFVQDNGEPSEGPDETGFFPPQDAATFEASDPSTCADPNTGPYAPGEEGNFVVHDAD